jgi:peptide/nickel transport system permease protein
VPASLVAVATGIPLGVFAARRRGRVADPAASAAALVGFSMPVFVTGMLLVVVFSLTLGWLPPAGYVPFAEDPGGFLRHLALPVLALAAAPLATTMRMTRSSFLEHAGLDYVRTARAKGVAEGVVVRRHALWNALLPVVTLVGLHLGLLLSGAVLTETIFALPGLGRLTITSVLARDYPVVQGVVLIGAVIFVVANLAVDVLYAWLDPRIRYS